MSDQEQEKNPQETALPQEPPLRGASGDADPPEAGPPQPEDFAQLFESQEKTYRAGQTKSIVMGRVVAQENDYYLIDVGLKGESRLPKSEVPQGLKVEPKTVLPLIKTGAAQEGFGPGLSLRGAVRRLQREELKTCLKEAMGIKAQIYRRQGDAFFTGLLIEVKMELGSSGAIPKNFWRSFPYPALLPLAEVDPGGPGDPRRWLGRFVEVQLLDLRADGPALVSRKKIIEAKREVLHRQTWQNAKEGDVLTARVKAIEREMIKMDIYGIETLLSQEDASWYPRVDLTKRFRMGDIFEVKLIRKDEAGNRFVVSRRLLEPHPADDLEKQFPSGAVVEGIVSKVLPNGGCFVRMTNSKREAYIAPTETSKEALPKEGESIKAIVVKVDRGKVRVILSPRKYEKAQMPKMVSQYSKENQPFVLGELLNPGAEPAEDDEEGR